jgi:hypothetical protein
MRYSFISLLLSVLLLTPTARAQSVSCTLDYDLPADIPVPTSQANNDTFQGFGWQSFLGLNAPSVGGQISTTGDNAPQWAAWSATTDLLLCQGSPTPAGCVCASGGCAQSGTHYYPAACRAVPNHENYRVLGQVSKVDDSFEEASTGGLSGDPVIDRFGGFLRYEILLSPATYDDIIQQQLYDSTHLMSLTSDINLQCGTSSYTGGDPANAAMGDIVVKNAWMDVTDALQSGEIDASQYHLDQVLVYTPYYRNSTGRPSCELRTMALVGMHIAHKTTNQPTWIWSTFEHNLNAPDCTGPMPGPNTQQQNTSCPSTVSANYNLYGENCNGSVQACMSCNAPPANNGTCTNPNTSVGSGYCLDEPPASNGGISKLCRQVPISSYPEAAVWNTACQTAIGTASVWGNYSLISSQWGTSAIPAGCADVASMISSGSVNDNLILPKVDAGGAMKSLLANTTMESYDRSNCIGCHSKGTFKNTAGTSLRTDFMYWLELQVLAPAASRPAFLEPTAAVTPTQTPAPSGGGGGGGCQVGAQGGSVWLLFIGATILGLWRHRWRQVR